MEKDYIMNEKSGRKTTQNVAQVLFYTLSKIRAKQAS
jgi:hypothetical protein